MSEDIAYYICKRCGHYIVDKARACGHCGWKFPDQLQQTDAPSIDNSVEQSKINPPYYKAGKIEVIDIIEYFDLGFHLGNVVKYVARAGRKGDVVEDLKKAQWYLERYIERLSKS